MITIVDIYIFKNLKIYFPLGFPGGSSDKKKSTCNAGNARGLGLISGSGRFLGGENGNPV